MPVMINQGKVISSVTIVKGNAGATFEEIKFSKINFELDIDTTNSQPIVIDEKGDPI